MSTWKKCCVKFCRKRVNPTHRKNKCAKHHTRQWKEKNPLRYSYNKLKYRAKERGHSFSLTFEEYKEFAVKSGYGNGKGKIASSLSINRIREHEGYHKDNIEVRTLSENSRMRYVSYYSQQRAYD